MPVETLTYAALGARLTISAAAARSLAKRLRLPRSLSSDGKALVSVDLAEIRHSPRPGCVSPWVPARAEPVVGSRLARTRWPGRDDSGVCDASSQLPAALR